VYTNGHNERFEEESLEQKSTTLSPSNAARKVAEVEEEEHKEDKEDKEDKAVKGDGKRKMKRIGQEEDERSRG
jgi:hypothetical protein